MNGLMGSNEKTGVVAPNPVAAKHRDRGSLASKKTGNQLSLAEDVTRRTKKPANHRRPRLTARTIHSPTPEPL